MSKRRRRRRKPAAPPPAFSEPAVRLPADPHGAIDWLALRSQQVASAAEEHAARTARMLALDEPRTRAVVDAANQSSTTLRVPSVFTTFRFVEPHMDPEHYPTSHPIRTRAQRIASLEAAVDRRVQEFVGDRLTGDLLEQIRIVAAARIADMLGRLDQDIARSVHVSQDALNPRSARIEILWNRILPEDEFRREILGQWLGPAHDRNDWNALGRAGLASAYFHRANRDATMAGQAWAIAMLSVMCGRDFDRGRVLISERGVSGVRTDAELQITGSENMYGRQKHIVDMLRATPEHLVLDVILDLVMQAFGEPDFEVVERISVRFAERAAMLRDSERAARP